MNWVTNGVHALEYRRAIPGALSSAGVGFAEERGSPGPTASPCARNPVSGVPFYGLCEASCPVRREIATAWCARCLAGGWSGDRVLAMAYPHLRGHIPMPRPRSAPPLSTRSWVVPPRAFQGRTPKVGRADAICRVLGITFVLGPEPETWRRSLSPRPGRRCGARQCGTFGRHHPIIATRYAGAPGSCPAGTNFDAPVTYDLGVFGFSVPGSTARRRCLPERGCDPLRVSAK